MPCLVLHNLNFGSFFHIDMFVDIILDKMLLLFLLLLSNLLMILLLIPKHILLITDIIFLQKSSELPSVFCKIFLVMLKQNQLPIHY